MWAWHNHRLWDLHTAGSVSLVTAEKCCWDEWSICEANVQQCSIGNAIGECVSADLSECKCAGLYTHTIVVIQHNLFLFYFY